MKIYFPWIPILQILFYDTTLIVVNIYIWRRAWQTTPVFWPGEPPWTEEPGGLQSPGSQRVRHDWVTKYDIYIEYYIEGKIELTFMCTLLSRVQLVANPWTMAHRGLCCGASQARMLEWAAMPYFRDPGIEPRSPALLENSLPIEPPGKLKNTGVGSLSLLQGIFPTSE